MTLKNCTWILVCLILSTFSISQAAEKIVTHKITEDETAWFLASLYYGNGNQYQKLLQTNHVNRPEDLKEGMKIQVSNPKYNPEDPQFKERYTKLWQARQKALGLTEGHSLPNSKVVIATEKIRQHDRLTQLHFNEAKNPQKSAAELAREELEKMGRSSGKDQ